MSQIKSMINNAFYDDLGERWYQDETHAIALLRAESQVKLQYVRNVLRERGIGGGAAILDIGCGAGLVANPLAADGFQVTGVDLSAKSLETARRHAVPGRFPTYRTEDAYHLSDESNRYDAVLMLDFLEHVDEPQRAVMEASRVLKPGGVLIYHTFNRTWLSYLLAIKAIEFFSRDCPPHVHVYRLFIKPTELVEICRKAGLISKAVMGIRPVFGSIAFWWTIFHRRLHPRFRFALTKALGVGYIGFACKQSTIEKGG